MKWKQDRSCFLFFLLTFDFPDLSALMVDLYPKVAFPDFITSCNLELILSMVLDPFFALLGAIIICVFMYVKRVIKRKLASRVVYLH